MGEIKRIEYGFKIPDDIKPKLSILIKSDNEISYVKLSNRTLVSNSPDIWSTIFENTVCLQHICRFKHNMPVLLSLLGDGGRLLPGYYEIRVYNANQTNIKAVLARSIIAKFGYRKLTEIDNHAIQNGHLNYSACGGDIIQVRIKSPAKLDPSLSEIGLPYLKYIP